MGAWRRRRFEESTKSTNDEDGRRGDPGRDGRGDETRRRQRCRLVASDTVFSGLDGRSISPRARTRTRTTSIVDIPFEFVGEVASTRALAEASHVEGLATTRHGD